MITIMRRCVVLIFCLLLTGCGSSVTRLLEEDSQLWWQSDPIIAAAENLDQGLVDSVYEAEAAKHEACEPIIGAARQQIYEGQGSLGERFWSDLTQLVALIVPISSVNECAEAQERYSQELASLCQRLNRRDVFLRCPD